MTGEQSIDPARLQKHLAAWSQRAEIARRHGQDAVADAATVLVSEYGKFIAAGLESEPAVFAAANTLRRKIEASEQHRTMSVEHGLGDEAIDVTLEIQEMEKELVALVSDWQKQQG